MLQTLRSASKGRAAKVLFGILLASFAVWGMGPVFRGGRVHTAATAGSVKISATEVEDAYRREIQNIERQYGLAMTPEIAAKLGLKRQIAQQMVMQSLYDQEARKMGVVLGTDLVKQALAAQPMFRDESGKFSPARFQQMLQAVRLPEAAYIHMLRGDMARSLLMGGIRAGATPTDELTRRIYAYENEKRLVDAQLVKAADISSVPQPTDEELKKFHDDHSDQYLAPEFRALSYISVDMDKVAESINLSDDDLHKAYDAAPEDYAEPEKRDIVQVTTDNQVLAQKMAEEAATKPLEEVAKEHNVMAHPLAGLAKGSVLPVLANVIFKLEPNVPSPAIHSPMGWHVIVVTKITPAQQRSFEEAREQIAKQLKSQQAQEQAEDLSRKLEDAMAGGATLEEAGQKLNLPVTKIDAISAFGLRPDDSDFSNPEELVPIVKTAFTLQQGEASPAQTTDKGFHVVQVNGITPSHVKPLAEVHDKVVADWTAARRADMADSRANELAESLRKNPGQSHALERLPTLSRDGHDHGLLADGAVPAIFAAKVGDMLTSRTPEGTWVIRVAEVQPADMQTAKLDPTRDELKAAMANDLLEQFGTALRKSYGVSINPAWLGQTTQEQ